MAPLLNGLLKLLPTVELEQCEEVQLVKYQGAGQGFGWHEDVLSADEANPHAGGQRIATLLVYLNDCENGRTLFRDLRGGDNRRLGVASAKERKSITLLSCHYRKYCALRYCSYLGFATENIW